MKTNAEGYRVDVWLNEIGKYVEYVGGKNPETRDMAFALGEHLRRNQAGGRIVEVYKNVVLAEWLPRASCPHTDLNCTMTRQCDCGGCDKCPKPGWARKRRTV